MLPHTAMLVKLKFQGLLKTTVLSVGIWYKPTVYNRGQHNYMTILTLKYDQRIPCFPPTETCLTRPSRSLPGPFDLDLEFCCCCCCLLRVGNSPYIEYYRLDDCDSDAGQLHCYLSNPHENAGRSEWSADSCHSASCGATSLKLAVFCSTTLPRVSGSRLSKWRTLFKDPLTAVRGDVCALAHLDVWQRMFESVNQAHSKPFCFITLL